MVASIREVLAPHFYNMYNDFMNERHSHYWLQGGRGSVKSSDVAVCIVMGMMKNRNANCICARQYGTSLHLSVFSQIVWAINILGVSHLWHIPRGDRGASPITYKPFGTKIFFAGLDNPEGIKSIKCKIGFLKYSWYEEVAQFKDMAVIRNANQSIRRGSNEKFITFYSYNPPRSKGNWVNEESELMNIRPDCFHSHTNWEMLPEELALKWLGSDWIKDALELKKKDPEAYTHEYLGIPTGYGTGVFKNINCRTITNDEVARFDNVAGGIDWGFAEDPVTYTKSHYDRKGRKLYIFEEVFVTGMSNRELANRIKETLDNPKILIVADSEEPKSIHEMNNDYGLRNIMGAKKGSGSIEYGIKFLQDLDEIIIDPDRCPNSRREFLNAEYDVDKFGNILPRLVDKNNHILDNIRYRMELENKQKWGW